MESSAGVSFEAILVAMAALSLISDPEVSVGVAVEGTVVIDAGGAVVETVAAVAEKEDVDEEADMIGAVVVGVAAAPNRENIWVKVLAPGGRGGDAMAKSFGDAPDGGFSVGADVDGCGFVASAAEVGATDALLDTTCG